MPTLFHAPLTIKSKNLNCQSFCESGFFDIVIKNYNETLTVDVDENNDQYQQLSQRLQRVLGRHFNLNRYEMSYFYGFLLAKGYNFRL